MISTLIVAAALMGQCQGDSCNLSQDARARNIVSRPARAVASIRERVRKNRPVLSRAAKLGSRIRGIFTCG